MNGIRDIIINIAALGARAAVAAISAVGTAVTALIARINGAGGLTGAMGGLGRAANAAWSVIRRLAYALPGVGIAGLIGAIGAAFLGLWSAIAGGDEYLGTSGRGAGSVASGMSRITEEIVKQKTGLDDLTPGMHQYALSLGLVSEKSLTLRQQQAALWATLNGGSTSLGAAQARLKAIDNEMASIPLFISAEDYKARINRLISEKKNLEKLEKQFIDQANATGPFDFMKDNGGAATPTNAGWFRFDRNPGGRKGGRGRTDPNIGPRALDRETVAYNKMLLEAADKMRQEDNRNAVKAQAKLDKDLATAQREQTRIRDNESRNRTDIEAAVKAQQEAQYNKGKGIGSGDTFGIGLIGETDADKIRGIKDAMHEGIIRPSQIAKDALGEMAQGFADAGAAAIFEGKSFRQSTNEILKGIAKQATAKALFEGAAALASLAILDFSGAALHGKAAAAFGILAVATGLGAAATGGIGSNVGSSGGSVGASGRGAPVANTSGNAGNSGGATVYNFNIAYNGFRADTQGHKELVRFINSRVTNSGSDRIDRRAVA